MKLRHVTVKMEKNTNPPASEKRLKIYHVIASTAKNYWKKNGKVKFIFTALGIIVLFVYVGILQEKIMRGCYGDNESNDCSHGEKFKYELTLVLVKSFFALIFVQGILKIIFFFLLKLLNSKQVKYFLMLFCVCV